VVAEPKSSVTMHQRRAPGALALASLLTLGAVVSAPAPSSAQSKFSDIICPNATEPVREYEGERHDQPPAVDRLIAAAKKAIAAYDDCASLKLTEGEATAGRQNQATAISTDSSAEREHYANLRSAQYYVTIGRLHRYLERFDLARSSYQAALELLKGAIEWQSPAQVNFRSNNINIGMGTLRKPSTSYSAYRTDAIAIRDVALAELARLPSLEKASGATAAPR